MLLTYKKRSISSSSSEEDEGKTYGTVRKYYSQRPQTYGGYHNYGKRRYQFQSYGGGAHHYRGKRMATKRGNKKSTGVTKKTAGKCPNSGKKLPQVELSDQDLLSIEVNARNFVEVCHVCPAF